MTFASLTGTLDESWCIFSQTMPWNRWINVPFLGGGRLGGTGGRAGRK
jgi:hypothetical protein